MGLMLQLRSVSLFVSFLTIILNRFFGFSVLFYFNGELHFTIQVAYSQMSYSQSVNFALVYSILKYPRIQFSILLPDVL